jgi:hypothetical protein
MFDYLLITFANSIRILSLPRIFLNGTFVTDTRQTPIFFHLAIRSLL